MKGFILKDCSTYGTSFNYNELLFYSGFVPRNKTLIKKHYSEIIIL
jgi:hypothetical protein